MTYIGYGIFIFGLIRLAVSFFNWVSRLYLPSKDGLKDNQAVSILIPARNEEDNIGDLLGDLASIRYKPLEILVYDDSSTDNTASIVQGFADRHEHIRLIKGVALPDGWMGKNFACHRLASVAKGDRLLFLDADVRVKNDIVGKSLLYMEEHSLKLLSVFPTQIMPTAGSRLVVPIMNWILLSLLPLPLVRLSDRPSLSAANGQFMLFGAEEYSAVQPHLYFKNNQVEDIAIIKEYKRRKLKAATLLGGDDIYCRMYSGLKEGIEGFSKNVFGFFGGSPVLCVLFALATTVAPFWLFIFNGTAFGIVYLLAVLLIRVFVSLSSRQSVMMNILLLIPQQCVFWRIIFAAFNKSKNKKLIWKGRNISAVS